jgi:hypothetical protein
MKNKSTHVYILQMGDFDIYRVGITNDKSKSTRYRVLQHGNPYKLKEIFYEYYGPIYAPILEKMLIRALRRYKMDSNDWFYVKREVLDNFIS